jgi:hypothetical protein
VRSKPERNQTFAPDEIAIIGCDTIAQFEENVQLARELTPLSDNQAAGVVARRARLQAIALLQLLRPGVTTCGGADAACAAGVSSAQ